MKKPFPRPAIGTATLSLLALGCSLAHAQTAAPTLKEITVTGNPLGATDLITPATQYSGAGLLLRSKTTLGETLDGTPGVRLSLGYFSLGEAIQSVSPAGARPGLSLNIHRSASLHRLRPFDKLRTGQAQLERRMVLFALNQHNSRSFPDNSFQNIRRRP